MLRDFHQNHRDICTWKSRQSSFAEPLLQREDIKGQLILRFSDTNPSKEKQDFVDNILKDCATLGLDYDKLTYTSDSFPQIFEVGG